MTSCGTGSSVNLRMLRLRSTASKKSIAVLSSLAARHGTIAMPNSSCASSSLGRSCKWCLKIREAVGFSPEK
jgi:hypothetical protein